MSNARAFRRARRRELGGHGRPGRIETAWIPAWAGDEKALEEAKQETHDFLIETLGHARRSGVSWGIYEAGERAEKAMGELFERADPAMADVLRRIRGHLREYGGWLVVGMADGVR